MKLLKHMAVLIAALVLPTVLFAGEHPSAGEHPAAKEMPGDASGMLDGKMAVGEMGKTDESTGDEDLLIFMHGMFRSTACEAYGFHATPYKAQKMDDGRILFTAEGTNEAKETISWSGVVKDGKVEATAMYHTDSEDVEYWYKGTLKHKDHMPSTEDGMGVEPRSPDHPH